MLLILANDSHTSDNENSGLQLVVSVNPNYPRKALIAQIEGSVTVQFKVTVDGMVKDAVVVESNPVRIFDEEAIRAVMKWKFIPARVDGKFIESIVEQTIEFKLNTDTVPNMGTD